MMAPSEIMRSHAGAWERTSGRSASSRSPTFYGKGKHVKIFYPQFEIQMVRFRGKNRLADFADCRQYCGHTFVLLRQAESFLMDHVPIAGRVVPGKVIREDQPWYPPRATREALTNALCHRDYIIPGGAVALAMYNDHLEITNPGALQFGKSNPAQATLFDMGGGPGDE